MLRYTSANPKTIPQNHQSWAKRLSVPKKSFSTIYHGPFRIFPKKLAIVLPRFILVLAILVPLLAPAPASASSLQVGEIIFWAGQAADIPDGLLVADGSALAPASYPELFDVIGVIYGGDGVNTFNLPNLNGRVPVGAYNHICGGCLYFYHLGATGGEAVVTLTEAQMPAHNHPPAGGASGWYFYHGAIGDGNLRIIDGAGIDTKVSGSMPSVGGGQPHPNMPPYIALYALIVAVPNTQPPPGDYITYEQGETIIALLQSIDGRLETIEAALTGSDPISPTNVYTETLSSGDVVSTYRTYTYGEKSMSSLLVFNSFLGVLQVIVLTVALRRR